MANREPAEPIKSINPPRTEFTSSSREKQHAKDFHNFTYPFSFEKTEDGNWTVSITVKQEKEPVTQQPIEILESILIRRLMEDTSGQSRISIPGLYQSRFPRSVDQFMDFLRKTASCLGVRVEDLNFGTLEGKLNITQTRRDIEAIKRIKESVETGEYGESYEQARLNSLAGESAVPFFRLSLLKDALSGDIEQFTLAGESDGTTNPYTYALFKRQDKLKEQRKKVITGINDKLNKIRQLKAEASTIEASIKM